MTYILKGLAVSAALAIVAVTSISSPASAISAALAKKCQAIAFKAHPPTRIGSKQGSAQAERDAFKKCISNDGKEMGGDTQKIEAPSQRPEGANQPTAE